MKIPKKLVSFITSVAISAGPLVADEMSERLKENKEKKEQEKRYANQKNNGTVKYASIVFTLISVVLTILAFKQAKIVLGIIGLLAIAAYVVTFLYCIDIIEEKKHNTYKIVFLIGDMLMIAVGTLLFF